MNTLTFSAAGAAHLFATNKKLDLAKLDPRLLEGVTTPASAAPPAETEAKATVAQSLRAQFLEAMSLTEKELLAMPAQTRAELEEQIVRDVQRDAASRPNAPVGSYLDVSV